MPSSIEDARIHPVARTLPLTHRFDIRAHIGVELFVEGGDQCGILGGFSHTVGSSGSGTKLAVLESIGAIIGAEIKRELTAYAGREATTQRIRAIIADDALECVSQTIIDLHSGKPAGYEALTRFPVTEGEQCSTQSWFSGARAV